MAMANKFGLGSKFRKPGTSSSSGSAGTATTSTSPSTNTQPLQSPDHLSSDSETTSSPRSVTTVLPIDTIQGESVTRSSRFRMPSLPSLPKSPSTPVANLPKSPITKPPPMVPQFQSPSSNPRDSPDLNRTGYANPSIDSPPSVAQSGNMIPGPLSPAPTDVAPRSKPKPLPVQLENIPPTESASSLKLENVPEPQKSATFKSSFEPKGSRSIILPSQRSSPPAPAKPLQPLTQLKSPSSTFGLDRQSKPLLFEDELQATQKVIQRMTVAHTALVVIAAGLEAAEWLPVVGGCVSLVAELVDTATKVSISKISALRLVERSALLIEAIETSISRKAGLLPASWQSNLTDLLETLNEIAFLLTKLSKRSFLKLYIKSDEMNLQIERAGEKLEDCVKVFQLQSYIEIAAWQEQSRRDFHADFQELTSRIETAMNDDKAMLQIVCEKNDQLQESVKALQRRLEMFMQMYEAEWHQYHPSTLITMRDTDVNQAVHGPSVPAPLPPNAAVASAALSGSQQSSASHNQMTKHTRVSFGGLDETDLSKLSYPPAPASPLTASPVSFSHPPPPDLQIRKGFYEKAINALRSVSGAESDIDIPDWTITSLEITKDERISTGSFSVVWKGTYAAKEVAIKELNEGVERDMFVREVNVWRNLRSPFILEFLGASSTTDPPPWFLVSPYMHRGNIMHFLGTDEGKKFNRLKLVHQVSQGLEYLHSVNVIHGDFKGNNVLINSEGHALICDFGLSKIKMDIARKSGTDITLERGCSGTLRWQSPERMLGGKLTRQVDVYAFGMTVYEIYSLLIPFFHFDGSMVRRDVKRGKRPPRADGLPDALWALQQRCWAQVPSDRPTFAVISEELAKMYTISETERKLSTTSNSQASASSSSSEEEMYFDLPTGLEEQVVIQTVEKPSVDTKEENSSSSSSSFHSSHSPACPVTADNKENDRIERLYRHSLRSDYADLLAVALWNPTPVKLGTVGYIRHGTFHELFDANMPIFRSSQPPIPTLHISNRFDIIRQPVNVRTIANNVLQKLSFWSASGVRREEGVSRQYSFPLHPGRSEAALVIEDGVLERYKDTDLGVTKEYLKANIDWILENYAEEHKLTREDVVIVYGTLSACHWAMFVSTFKPRTKVNFNVWQQPRSDQPWGTWATASDSLSTGYQHKLATKVSALSPLSVPDAVMIGRWQFVTGSLEPFLGAT